MATGTPAKIFALVFMTTCLVLAQQQSTSPVALQNSAPVRQEPTGSGATSPEAQEPTKQQAKTQQESEAAQRPLKPLPKPKEEAWQILDTACKSNKPAERVIATAALGLLRDNVKARKLAEKALADEKPEVRSSAAGALGAMLSKASVAKLRDAAEDPEPLVALAAAQALIRVNDDSGYEVYYEVLTGQRKGGKGLIASQTAILKDPKKMAELGIQEGVGFIPFGGIGWQAYKTIHKNDSSPVRAAAAKILAKDPDPGTTKALEEAAGDKNWIVRTAALEALSERGDPSVLATVELYMGDEKDAVKYTAAAAVLRLSAIKESGIRVKKRKRRWSLRGRKLGKRSPT